ncbi:MAG: hypothetical protein ACRYG8_14520 [Janthinobacterium lividum]
MPRSIPSLVLLVASGLSGCTRTDPLLNRGLWNPSGVNEANIAAMVANPADLYRGVDAPGADGTRAAAAVLRLETNRVKPLASSSITTVKTSDTNGGQSSDTTITGGN